MDRKRFTQWPELIFGILFVLFGLVSFLFPSLALSAMAVLYGVIALLSGISALVNWFSFERSASSGFGFSLVVGILNTLVGLYLLFNIGAGRATLAFIFPIWLIIFSVTKFTKLRQVRFYSGEVAYWFTIIAAVLGLVLGVLLLFSRLLSGILLVYVIGGYLIFQGGSSILSALMRWRRGM